MSLSFKSILAVIDLRYYYHFRNNEVGLKFGSIQKEIHIGLDLTSEYTWLCFPNPNDYASNTSVLLDAIPQFTYLYNEYGGIKIEDTVQIDELKPIPLTFLIASRIQFSKAISHQGTLGLAYSFTNKNTSLIHTLKAEGLIDHLSFSFKKQMRFFLGGIRKEDTIGLFHSSCDVLGKNNSWNCPISNAKIVYGSKILNYPIKDSYISFSTNKDFNFVPKAFFDYLVNNLYDEEIKRKYYYLSIKPDRRQIYSHDDGETNYGIILFTIGNYVYSVPLAKFWYCDEITCDFNILENPYGDYWILGMMLYNEHNAFFDYEEGKIHFYSSTGVTIAHNLNSVSCRVLVGNILFMLSGTTWLLISKIKYYRTHYIITDI